LNPGSPAPQASVLIHSRLRAQLVLKACGNNKDFWLWGYCFLFWFRALCRAFITFCLPMVVMYGPSLGPWGVPIRMMYRVLKNSGGGMPCFLAVLNMAFWIFSGSSSVFRISISSFMAFSSSVFRVIAVSRISSKSFTQFRAYSIRLFRS
jgi:hypothetical protein